jgi:hypothetical protein
MFATVNAMHGHACARHPEQCYNHLSEQHAIDCKVGSHPCEGGYARDQLPRFASPRGLVYDTDSFTEYAGRRKNSCSDYSTIPGTRVGSQSFRGWSAPFRYINSECESCIIEALQYGPLIVSVRIEDVGYGPYDCQRAPRGLWNTEDGVRQFATLLPVSNHIVNLVGYDLSRRVWILRNSWGPNWNDRGNYYFDMDGDHRDEVCMMERLIMPGISLIAEEHVQSHRKRQTAEEGGDLVVDDSSLYEGPLVIPVPVRVIGGDAAVSASAQYLLTLPRTESSLTFTFPINDDPTIWDRSTLPSPIFASYLLEATFWLETGAEVGLLRDEMTAVLSEHVAEVIVRFGTWEWRSPSAGQGLIGERGLRIPLCSGHQGTDIVDVGGADAAGSLTIVLNSYPTSLSDGRDLRLALGRLWWVDDDAATVGDMCTTSSLPALRVGEEGEEGGALSTWAIIGIAVGAILVCGCVCLGAGLTLCVANRRAPSKSVAFTTTHTRRGSNAGRHVSQSKLRASGARSSNRSATRAASRTQLRRGL